MLSTIEHCEAFGVRHFLLHSYVSAISAAERKYRNDECIFNGKGVGCYKLEGKVRNKTSPRNTLTLERKSSLGERFCCDNVRLDNFISLMVSGRDRAHH